MILKGLQVIRLQLVKSILMLIDLIHLHWTIDVLLVEAGRQRMAAALHLNGGEITLLIGDQHRVVGAGSIPVIVLMVVKVEVLVLHREVVFIHDVARRDRLVILLFEVTDQTVLVVAATRRHLHVLLLLMLTADLVLLLLRVVVGLVAVPVVDASQVHVVVKRLLNLLGGVVMKVVEWLVSFRRDVRVNVISKVLLLLRLGLHHVLVWIAIVIIVVFVFPCVLITKYIIIIFIIVIIGCVVFEFSDGLRVVLHAIVHLLYLLGVDAVLPPVPAALSDGVHGTPNLLASITPVAELEVGVGRPWGEGIGSWLILEEGRLVLLG